MIAKMPDYNREPELDALGFPIDDSGGFCGTIALERSMGIGIWKGPTENDLLIEALEEELSELVSGLNAEERSSLMSYILNGMGWTPSGMEADDPLLQETVDATVGALRTSGSLAALTEGWLRSSIICAR